MSQDPANRDWLPVAGSMVAVAWGGNEFTPLLVMYREQSHFSQVTVNGLLAAYVIGIVPALLISGPLSDYIGRRPTMLPAAPLSLAGSFLLSIAPEEPLIIAAGRVLCGLALGIVMAVGSTWISELITRSRRRPPKGIDVPYPGFPHRCCPSLGAGPMGTVAHPPGLCPTHPAHRHHCGVAVEDP